MISGSDWNAAVIGHGRRDTPRQHAAELRNLLSRREHANPSGWKRERTGHWRRGDHGGVPAIGTRLGAVGSGDVDAFPGRDRSTTQESEKNVSPRVKWGPSRDGADVPHLGATFQNTT